MTKIPLSALSLLRAGGHASAVDMDPNAKDSAASLLDIHGGLKDLDALLSGAPAATLSSLLYYLEDSQWLPADAIEKNQFKQLGLLAAHAFAHSPYFQARMERAGLMPQDIASPEGLRKLPAVTRRDMEQAGDTLHCAQIPPAHMPWGKTLASSSTGKAMAIHKTTINILFSQALMIREHFWHKRDFKEKLMVIHASGHRAPADQQGWGSPVSFLFESGAVRALPTTMAVEEQINEIRMFSPSHLLIYPADLDAIIAHCQKANIMLSGIRHIWCHAAIVPPELRCKAESFFGARVEDNYSAQETGIMALQCPDSGLYHIMSESVIVEVLDESGEPCLEGKTGKVVVTDLHNFATPIIRYELGGYAEAASCPCGRGLSALKAVRVPEA